MKRFLLVDDHSVIRTGLCHLLSEMYPSCRLDEAANGDEARAALAKSSYDLVIMDIKMPGTDTLELVQFLFPLYPDARILIFSMNPEDVYARRFMKAGCFGFVSKEAEVEEVQKAIRTVAGGKRYMSDEFIQLLAADGTGNMALNPFEKLTAREFEIVGFMLTGKGVGEIGHMLNLSISTVATHKYRLFKKLNVSNVISLKDLATSYHI